jgi:nucleoside-diphosphate-sugar epimerase
MGVSQVAEANLENTGWHAQLDPSQDFVVNCVGAASRALDGYRQSYVEGQDSIGQWLSGGEVGSLLFTSSISVYPQSEGRSVDEMSSNEGASERGQLLLEAEEKCLASVVNVGRSFVLRLAGLYGPNRHLMVEKLKGGQPFEGNANRTLNLIHVADAAAAVLHCLEAKPGNRGGIYNVSDGSHYSRGEIVAWLAEKLGVGVTPFLENDGAHTPDRKVSIDKIRNDLKWEPRYNSFVKGYESILG